MTAAEALALIDRLEQLAARGGWADTDALREVKRICFQLQRAPGPYSEVSDKVGGVENWAEILFSARKHQRWGVDGVIRVRAIYLGDCMRLRMIVRGSAERTAPGEAG